MKIAISALLSFLFWKVEAQALEFKLYHCETESLIQIKGDNLYFETPIVAEIIYKTELTKSDQINLNIQFEAILKKREMRFGYMPA